MINLLEHDQPGSDFLKRPIGGCEEGKQSPVSESGNTPLSPLPPSQACCKGAEVSGGGGGIFCGPRVADLLIHHCLEYHPTLPPAHPLSVWPQPPHPQRGHTALPGPRGQPKEKPDMLLTGALHPPPQSAVTLSRPGKQKVYWSLGTQRRAELVSTEIRSSQQSPSAGESRVPSPGLSLLSPKSGD